MRHVLSPQPHFFLGCFGDHEVEEVIHAIASHAAGNATWLVSEFQIPQCGLARHAGSLANGALYAAFGNVDRSEGATSAGVSCRARGA